MPKQRGHAVWITEEDFYTVLRKIAFEWTIRDGKSWEVSHVVVKLLKDTIKENELDR